MWNYHKVLEFERADLVGDEKWFAANWPQYRIEMTNHVIMTTLVFNWKAFDSWLRSRNDDEFAQEIRDVLTQDVLRQKIRGFI